MFINLADRQPLPAASQSQIFYARLGALPSRRWQSGGAGRILNIMLAVLAVIARLPVFLLMVSLVLGTTSVDMRMTFATSAGATAGFGAASTQIYNHADLKDCCGSKGAVAAAACCCCSGVIALSVQPTTPDIVLAGTRDYPAPRRLSGHSIFPELHPPRSAVLV